MTRVRSATKPGPRPILGDEPDKRIYEAALQCMERKGLRRTTMDDIAVAAGVSRTAVYHYFPNKKALVHEVMVGQAVDLLDNVEQLVTGLNGLEKIVEATYQSTLLSIDNRQYRAIVDFTMGQDAIVELMNNERFMGVHAEFWIPVLQDAMALGELRSDRAPEEIMHWIISQEYLQVTMARLQLVSAEQIEQTYRTYLSAALAA